MAQRRSPRLQPRFHPARHRFAVRQAAKCMTSMKRWPGDIYAGAPGYLCDNGSGSAGGGCRDGSGGLGRHCERSNRGTSGDDDYCGQYSRDANVLQFHQRYLLWQREVHVRLHAPTLPSSIASCMPPPSLRSRHGARQTLPAKALPSKLHACDGRLKAVDTTGVAETLRRQLQHHVHHRLGMLCRGDGYFEGPGNYTMDYGTFDGYGLINGSSGSYTGENTVKTDCSHPPHNL